MTELIIIGKSVIKETKKPIKFEKVLLSSYKVRDSEYIEPKQYKYIELICKNYTPNNDLIFAYNNKESRSNGVLYIGKWNDGVVE